MAPTSDDDDGRPIRAQLADLRQRQKRHRELIAELQARVDELEDRDRTKREQIQEQLAETDRSYEAIADHCDCTVSYVKQIDRGTL